MKLLLALLLALPIILAADLRSMQCPDGTECPAGTTCELSESAEGFECRDLPAEDLRNRRMFVGWASDYTLDAPTTTSSVCDNGTWCDGDRCCPTLKRAICCSNLKQCCPTSTQCCGNSTVIQWCCPLKKTRCYENYGLCVAGASAATPVVAGVVLAALLVMWKGFVH